MFSVSLLFETPPKRTVNLTLQNNVVTHVFKSRQNVIISQSSATGKARLLLQ